MRPGREVCHAPALVDEVKNEWSYTFAPHVYLDDVNRTTVPFIFIKTYHGYIQIEGDIIS
jgi:hypothetical protein